MMMMMMMMMMTIKHTKRANSLSVLHINTLARPANYVKRENLSMREHCWLGQRGQLFSYKNAF